MIFRILIIALLFCTQAWAYEESPELKSLVELGQLPPLEERLPTVPAVSILTDGQVLGQYGGRITMQMTAAKETRQMVVYGYARLMRFNRNYELQPDILQSVDIEDGRIFTLNLRPKHKWSDGAEFTAEDFRFWWEDVANNEEIYPSGPPASLKVNGKLPTVEIISPYQVRYSWDDRNPNFLPQLAKASPLYIYAPKHYLQEFHAKYQDAEILEAKVAEYSKRNWSQLFNSLRKSYANRNPDLPSLQPWVLRTRSPSQSFSFTRNPYFHRVDSKGRQLPYIDEWRFNITQKKLISLKAATAESNLQARHLRFSDISLLVQNQGEYNFDVHFWKQGRGSHMALYPNLNAADEQWREVLRDKRFRQALSLAINRTEINRVIYFATASPSQNSLLPESPLFKGEYRQYLNFDLNTANRLLDSMELTEKDGRGIRKLKDGRSMDIIVESASGGTEQSDVLSLIADSWAEIGIKLHIKPTSLEVARRRIFSGFTRMYIANGIDNGIATADTSPEAFVPLSQVQYQWPMWGQYHQTGGKSGEPVDMDEGWQLQRLYEAWNESQSPEQRQAIWDEILQIHSENLFSIGIVSGTIQPVVVASEVRNVPKQGIWAWDPGAHFGLYNTELFWIDS